MNLFSSMRGFFRTLGMDIQLSLHGAWPGWFTRNHYRGRLQERRKSSPAVISTRLKVHGQGVRVFVYPQHLGAMLGVFVDGEYDLTKLQPGFQPQTILDLGANAGMASGYLHALFPKAQFACVEPDPRNLKLLEQAIAANAISARIIPAAISNQPGELQLRFGDDPTCSALETSPMHNLANTVPVKVVTVPQVLEQLGWDKIDLLKVDIEGSEFDLFRSDNEWLNKVGTIIVEIHPNTTPEEIGSFLQPYGFQLTRTQRGREPVFLAKTI